MSSDVRLQAWMKRDVLLQHAIAGEVAGRKAETRFQATTEEEEILFIYTVRVQIKAIM